MKIEMDGMNPNREEEQRNRLIAYAERMMLPDIFRTWVLERRADLKPTTQAEYLSILMVFYDFCRQRNLLPSSMKVKGDAFVGIRRNDIEDFVDWQGTPEGTQRKKVSGQTVHIRLAVLRSFFSWLEENRNIPFNPVDGVTARIRPEEMPMRLEQEDVYEFFHTVWDIDDAEVTPYQKKLHRRERLRNILMMRLLLETGMSAKELVALNIEDVEDGRIQFSKKTNDLLCRYLEKDGHSADGEFPRSSYSPAPEEKALFLSKMSHSRIAVRTVNAMINSYSQLAFGGDGKRITVNELRRAADRHIDIDREPQKRREKDQEPGM